MYGIILKACSPTEQASELMIKVPFRFSVLTDLTLLKQQDKFNMFHTKEMGIVSTHTKSLPFAFIRSQVINIS